jgi:hypothetical protein
MACCWACARLDHAAAEPPIRVMNALRFNHPLVAEKMPRDYQLSAHTHRSAASQRARIGDGRLEVKTDQGACLIKPRSLVSCSCRSRRPLVQAPHRILYRIYSGPRIFARA